MTNSHNNSEHTSKERGSRIFEWTFYPVLAMAALSLFGALGSGEMYLAWFLAFGYAAIALAVGAGYLLIAWMEKNDSRKRRVRIGIRILLSVLLSVVVLAGSCAVNLSTFDPGW